MILEIQRNGEQLHVFNLKESDVVLGRGREADCPINAEDISRLHCRIKHKDGKYYVQDLKSSNGTFVYDEKIPPGDFHEFLPDFPLKIGKSVLVYVRDTEPLQDIGYYDKTNPSLKVVSPTEKTQTFTGMIKKDALKTKKTTNKSMNLGLLLVPLLLGAGAAFYYFSLRTEPAPAPVVAPRVEEVVEPNLVNVPKEGCIYDDEKSLCQGLELPQGDYVNVQTTEITVVLNWQRLLENKTAEVATLPEEKRELFLVVNLLTKLRTQIASMSQLAEVQNIVLVGTSPNYKKALKKITVPFSAFPPDTEITPVVQAAITSGNTQDFDAKYGPLFQLVTF